MPEVLKTQKGVADVDPAPHPFISIYFKDAILKNRETVFIQTQSVDPNHWNKSHNTAHLLNEK